MPTAPVLDQWNRRNSFSEGYLRRRREWRRAGGSAVAPRDGDQSLQNTAPMTHRLRQLLFDDSGQDLIEYGLLASATGFAAMTAVSLLMGSMNTTYSSWDATVQNIWEIQDPIPDPPAPPSTPTP